MNSESSPLKAGSFERRSLPPMADMDTLPRRKCERRDRRIGSCGQQLSSMSRLARKRPDREAPGAASTSSCRSTHTNSIGCLPADQFIPRSYGASQTKGAIGVPPSCPSRHQYHGAAHHRPQTGVGPGGSGGESPADLLRSRVGVGALHRSQASRRSSRRRASTRRVERSGSRADGEATAVDLVGYEKPSRRVGSGGDRPRRTRRAHRSGSACRRGADRSHALGRSASDIFIELVGAADQGIVSDQAHVPAVSPASDGIRFKPASLPGGPDDSQAPGADDWRLRINVGVEVEA